MQIFRLRSVIQDTFQNEFQHEPMFNYEPGIHAWTPAVDLRRNNNVVITYA